MGDMAPRPRGGWQTGTRLVHPTAADSFALDEWYTVTWLTPTVAEVRHFGKDGMCCAVQVEISLRDHAGVDPDPRVNALHRSYLHMEKKHGRR